MWVCSPHGVCVWEGGQGRGAGRSVALTTGNTTVRMEAASASGFEREREAGPPQGLGRHWHLAHASSAGWHLSSEGCQKPQPQPLLKRASQDTPPIRIAICL